jgi:hypothetical protein
MTPEQQRIADRIVTPPAMGSSTTFTAEAATVRRLPYELTATPNISLGPRINT